MFLFAFSVVFPHHPHQNSDSLKCFTLYHFVQPCIIQYCSEFYMSACFQNFTGVFDAIGLLISINIVYYRLNHKFIPTRGAQLTSRGAVG